MTGTDTNFYKEKEIQWQEISDKSVLVNAPLVSVNMITFNHEHYIAQAIEGVINQKTDFPFELIIGEDCSTDCTRDIVLQYQQKYPTVIRVLISQNNVGAHKNTRRVHASCRGRYIAFCEGDDCWHNPSKLQIQIEHLENNPAVGLVHADVDRYDTATNVRIENFHKDRRKLYAHSNLLNSMIVNEYVVETCTAVVRKSLLDEVYKTCNYEFSEIFLMGDVQTWIEIANRSEIKYFEESFATRNLLPESVCRSNDVAKQIRFAKSAMIMHLHYADKYGGKDALLLKTEIVRSFSNSLIKSAFLKKRPGLTKETFQIIKKYRVPFNLSNYLYFIATKKNIASYVLAVTISHLLRTRLAVSHIKWLRYIARKIKNISCKPR